MTDHLPQMSGVPQHPYQAYQAYQAVQTLPGRSVPRLLRQRVHASVNKKQYYFGLKVSVIVTEAGEPVEMVLVPGSTTDITALRSMDLNLPEGSTTVRTNLVCLPSIPWLDHDKPTKWIKEAASCWVVRSSFTRDRRQRQASIQSMNLVGGRTNPRNLSTIL